MYSRRQRSTRNAAATTNANASTNSRTTRGRTNKAKHPRRGGGNPDTARVRSSIERPPVVPWVKVMRPPALHLRRTFLVEKWVRPSDLTTRERGVYDAEQKEKEEERQRLLKLQQQKRDQEEKEKERDEQQQREQKEKELSVVAAAITAEHGGENAKRAELRGNEQHHENLATKLVSDASMAIVPATTSSSTTTTTTATTIGAITKSDNDKPEAATAVPTLELEQAQAQAPSRGGGAEDNSTPAPSSPMSKTQGLSEHARVSHTEHMENKPMTPLVSDTNLLVNSDKNIREQEQALPLNNESELEKAPQANSSTPVTHSVEEWQHQHQRPSDAEDTSTSTEPPTKKLRVE